MPVMDLLRRNAREHGDEVALVELNPTMEDTRKISFKEFDLVQQTVGRPYRHEITWQIFDEKSNRVANMLLGRGIKKGDKVAILMFNCLEWLPIYFGILKTGAIAVPFNFSYLLPVILCVFGSLTFTYIKKEPAVCDVVSVDRKSVNEFGSEEHDGNLSEVSAV